ncbi:MAG: hypothetical protein M3R64_12420 [Pseudomonadota bacterium]|nr:hypothetical protein [Pseudomonadota bacterium]
MKRFKLVRVMMGSGWPSGHIAIDNYHTFPDKPGGNEKCLTLDAQNDSELSSEIDALIAELEEIRTSAVVRFRDWHDQYRRSQR